jgi:hypothetical protein
MVYGNFYGIQYEIQLTKDLDFYDDLLPIWSEVRARIEMEKDKESGTSKLIVITYQELNKQLNTNSLFLKFIKENDEASFYNEYKNEEDIISKKFVLVKQYIKYLKYNSDLPDPISEDSYKVFVESLEYVCNKLNKKTDLSQKEVEQLENQKIYLSNKLRVQRIIHNKKFFEEIKNLEKELIQQVNLSEEQNELIKKVVTHPKLEGIISRHGLTIIDGYY